MSDFEKLKRDEGAAGLHALWQASVGPPQALSSDGAAQSPHAGWGGLGHSSAGGEGSSAAAAAALSHWADGPSLPHPEGPAASPAGDEHHQGAWSVGGAWRGLKNTAAHAYDRVSGLTDAAGRRLHHAEQRFDHGVDRAESWLQRPTGWLAEQAHDVPVVGQAAQGLASLGKHTSHLLGGVYKGLGGAVFGLGNMAVHPLDTLRGLATMGSHLPGSPLWALRQGYRQAKGLYEAAAHGQDPSTALNPLATLKEDGTYWKGVGTQLIQPYRQSMKEGKPMEAAGRGLFDIGSLFVGGGEAKAAAEAGEVSKVGELSKLGEVPPVRSQLEAMSQHTTDLAKVNDATEATRGTSLAPAHGGEEAAAHADVGLADQGYRPQPGERSMTREQWQSQERRRRAEQTTGRADQPLEPVDPDKSQHGHGHADHGHQTTAEQQGDRIRTGITPSGRAGKPVSKVSHFHSPETEAEALGRARRQLKSDRKAGAVTNFDADGEPTRHGVVVPTNRRDGYGHRVIKQKDASGTVLKDSSGKPLTTTDPTALRQAKVIWEYVPRKNAWHPVTYYPE